jgi:dihydrofolate reductase
VRDLIITENITLDGVIDAAEGWFAPAGDDDVDQSDLIAALSAQRDAADAFLVGRTTFEELRGYWPQQTDDLTGNTEYLNKVSKYVVSSTLQDPEWDNTTVLRGPLNEEIHALKSATGADIVVTESMTLVRAVIANGLVDEYRSSSTRSSWAGACGCSPKPPTCRACSSSTPSHSAPGSCSCATGPPDDTVDLTPNRAAPTRRQRRDPIAVTVFEITARRAVQQPRHLRRAVGATILRPRSRTNTLSSQQHDRDAQVGRPPLVAQEP